MAEWKSGSRHILPQKGKKMLVAVGTNNQNLLKALERKKGIVIFALDDINDIVIQDYDLILIDVAICDSKLDVAKMQSSRTVFFVTDSSPQNLDKMIYSFMVGRHPFNYKFNGVEYTVDLNDIMFFESDRREVKGYTENGECIRFYSKLDDVQQRIDDYVLFLRVNKSCMINYTYARIEGYSVFVPGYQFQVSRTYQKEFAERVKIIKNM